MPDDKETPKENPIDKYERTPKEENESRDKQGPDKV